MRATARDVAALAGVSVFTVSRALTRPSSVSDATRARVLEAAASVGYVPKVSARAPGGGRAGAIGLVVRDASDPYTAALVRGVHNRANGAGYTVTVIDADDDVATDDPLDELARHVEGIVVAAPRVPRAQLFEVAGRRPLVLVNDRVEGLPGVWLDYGEGVRQALTYLRSLGHRRVALAGGPPSSDMSTRWVDYSTAFADSWPDLEAVDLGGFSLDEASGIAAADLAVDGGFTAVCAYHDVLAAGLVEGFRLRGVDVPGRMSVVGAGEPGGSRGVEPALTAVSVPMLDTGRAGVDILVSLLRDQAAPPAHHWDLAVHLELRDSTAPVSSPR